MGRKGDRGFPIDRDAWHVMTANAVEDRRDLHPMFGAFNGIPKDKRPKTVRGVIVHATEAECCELGLMNYTNVLAAKGQQTPPGRRPFCRGDGIRAERWNGKAGDGAEWNEMPCPHDKCEFRQVHGKTIPCKPFVRLLFRISWPEETQAALEAKGKPMLPEVPVRFASGSWNTAANVRGFFDSVHRQANGLGLSDYTLFGLPFLLTLGEKTSREHKSRFPVVSMAPAGLDPVQFFLQQMRARAALSAQPRPPALTDESEQAPATLALDHDAISAPAVPAAEGF